MSAPGGQTGKRIARWGSAAVLFAAALCVRVPWLGAIPSPAADEGNWVTFGLAYFRGSEPAIAADAGFVTTLYARLIALAYTVGGVSFAAARSVCALATALAAPCVYALCLRLGAPRAGLVAGSLVALHPWSIAWSRTASVPYALAFALLCVALPLTALCLRRPRALPLIAAGQLYSLGFHFTPLAACALPGLAVLARKGRVPLRPLAVAGLLALVHPALVLAGATRAIAATSAPGNPFTHLATRVAVYVRVCAECLSGQATVAHFSPAHVSPFVRALAALVCTTAVLVAARRRDLLARVGLAAFVSSIVALPLLLMRGRAWHLPTIDAERYGFVLVAPFALLVGSLAQSSRRNERALGLATLVAVFALGTLPLTYSSVAQGGPDRGVDVRDDGGAWHGHRATIERTPLAEQIVAATRAHAHGSHALLVYRDYAFHSVGLPMYRDDPGGVLRRARVIPSALRPGERVYVLTWAPEVYAPGYAPRAYAEENSGLRAMVRATPGSSLVRAWQQPDRTALLELWSLGAR